MCLDCGCLQPLNSHGDPRHITQKRMEQAAEANDNDPLESAKQIVKTLRHEEGVEDLEPHELFAGAANRPLLSFDVDNILAHKTEALITVLNMEDGKMREFAEMRDVEERKVWPDVKDVIKDFRKNPSAYLNLVPYPDAVAAAQALSAAGFTLMIATKRKPRIEEVTWMWLKNVEFPTVNKLFIGKNSKTEVCDYARAAGMSLVHFDDDPRNKALMERYYAKCKVLMPVRPYVPDTTPDSFDMWTDVMDLLGVGQTLRLPQEIAY